MIFLQAGPTPFIDSQFAGSLLQVAVVVLCGVVGVLFTKLSRAEREISRLELKISESLGIIISRLDTIEAGVGRWFRVMESRAIDSFLNANPITPSEVELFRRTKTSGASTMSDEELLAMIRALDREVDEGHISGVKRPDANVMLGVLNGHLAGREVKQESDDTSSTGFPITKRRPWWKFW